MIKLPQKAERPTLYFIGVTTGKSSIINIFPKWAKALGLGDVEIKGIDIPLHAEAENYRACVNFIKSDPLSLGALVTTHKIDIYNAAMDIFDELDGYADKFGELSCISKRNGLIIGHAKDPISSGRALEAFVPEEFWTKDGAEAAVIGAGGSALAICAFLAQKRKDGKMTIHLTNRSTPRLAQAVNTLTFLKANLSFHLCRVPEQNDVIIHNLKEGALIINATGLGKDRPGSPLTDSCVFPKNSLVWELNYRGTLEFMHQAKSQQKERNLTIEDGWTYFIHGWTQVIAEVFNIELTDEKLKICAELARQEN